MKKLLVRFVSLIAFMGLILGLTGCCSIFKSCLPPPAILVLGQPKSELVITNGEADFSVNALVGPSFTTNGLTYQWQVNKVLLISTNLNANWTNYTGPGATTSSITISNVQIVENNVYILRIGMNTFCLYDGWVLTILKCKGDRNDDTFCLVGREQ